MAGLALGLALLSRLSPESTALGIGLMMALCGFGFGFFQAPNNRTMLAAAPRARSGAAGGMLATARLLGMTLGATVVALVFQVVPERAEHGRASLIGTVFAIAAGTTSVLRLSRRTPAEAAAADLTPRARPCMLAGAIGLEPTTLGFGDRCSTD